MKRILRGYVLSLLLVLTVTGLVMAASASNPGFLDQNTAGVPGGTHTYRIWYTVDCGGDASCECLGSA